MFEGQTIKVTILRSASSKTLLWSDEAKFANMDSDSLGSEKTGRKRLMWKKK